MHSLFLIATLILVVQASWFGGGSSNTDDPGYLSWDTNDLRSWLELHNVPIPKQSATHEDLRGLVASNWDKASSWTYDQYTSAQEIYTGIRDTSFDKWDESRLREFLLKQGVVAPKGPKEHLVQLAKSKYSSYTDAASSFSSRATAACEDIQHQMSKSASSIASQATVWETWSDSCLHNWLVSHNVIKSDYEKNRDALLAQMKKYYYDPADVVWSAWSDSQLKQWLVDHDIVKSDAQASRDKMIKMVEDNYVSVKDTFWSAWSDISIHQWLVDHGYIRSDAQVKRDELIKLANEKYNDQNARLAAYLKWPDARLRAYLREHGVSEEYIPGDRPSLLQETRIRWIQTQNSAEALFSKIKEVVNSGVYKAEEALHQLTSLVGGYKRTECKETKDAFETSAETAEDMINKAREKLDEKVKVGEEKMKSEL